MPTELMGAVSQLATLKKLKAFGPYHFGEAQLEETKVEAKECAKRTPVEEGTLQASVHAVGWEMKGRYITTAVVAGEPGSGAEEYAAVVHEDLEAIHSVGEAKFIERPLMESAPFMAGRIAKRIDLNKVK